MITPIDIKNKASKLYLKVASSVWRKKALFPLVIPSNKKLSGSNFSDYQRDLVPLHQQSKQVVGLGYSVDWIDRKVNGSKQSIPSKVYFDSLEDFLWFISKQIEFDTLTNIRARIAAAFPTLTEWIDVHSEIVLKHMEAWDGIIEVCKYFLAHPPPHNYFVRELPVSVHSKFIEQNVGILKAMLDILLIPKHVDRSQSDFAGRYFLRKVSTYTQIRVLDDNLKPFLGYDECTLSLDDAAWLSWIPDKVFIIENQICYLTFPKVKNAVAIFGEGFKSRLTAALPWLGKTNLYCWFDLDSAGFEMLNMIRQIYPLAKSLMMDSATYNRFSHFSVENNSKIKDLRYLTEAEQSLYAVVSGCKRRLEQERISQDYVVSQIYKLN